MLKFCSLSPKIEERVDFSIIIVSWNTKQLLRECLLSIYETTRKVTLEIFVIDNDSRDGSPEMVQKEFPKVNLLCTGANLGFAKANNIGIKKSNSQYISLINSDVRVLEGCIDLLCAYMDQHPKTAVVGPRILNPDMTIQPTCYGFPTVWNTLTYSFGLGTLLPQSKLFGGFKGKYWPYDIVRNVEGLSGCFWVIRAKALEQIGLLDEHFFMYMEDFDWCKRCWKAGWEVAYCPDAQAIHYSGGSASNAPIENWVERHRSKIHYWNKHHGKTGVWYIIAAMLIHQVLRLIQTMVLYLFAGSKRNNLLLRLQESIASIRWFLNCH